MCSVTAAGDKRVTRMIRQHLKSKNPMLAETALKALSGALLELDVYTECYLPSRDELEHDDLEVGMSCLYSHLSPAHNYFKFLSFSCHSCLHTGLPALCVCAVG